MTVGWKLDRSQREQLLAALPPRYGKVVADHVTLSVSDTAPPPAVIDARIIGHVDDGAGVEACVVALEGSTTRPDGGTWHITWSLSNDRTARESNDVIAAVGWTEIPPLPSSLASSLASSLPLSLTPARW